MVKIAIYHDRVALPRSGGGCVVNGYEVRLSLGWKKEGKQGK